MEKIYSKNEYFPMIKGSKTLRRIFVFSNTIQYLSSQYKIFHCKPRKNTKRNFSTKNVDIPNGTNKII